MVVHGGTDREIKDFGKIIVLIEWFDSRGLENWECLKEIESMPPAFCCSVGFLVEDNAEYKTIAIGLSDTEQVLGRLTIPTGCIKTIKVLKEDGD